MPVFARTKLVMEELCITLRPRLDFTYTGPNPQKAYQKLMDILITHIAVPRENIQEKDFRWDRGGEEENFSAALEVIKDYDKFSYMQLTIAIKGTLKPSKEFGKEGNVRINIRGAIRAEYPQDTMWQKSIVYEFFRVLYHKILYVSTWEKYMEDCREMLRLFIEEMKAYLNLIQRTGI